jgi:hypothetical protein
VLGTGRGNLFQVLCVRVPGLLLFRNRHYYVAGIFLDMAEFFQSRLEARDTYGGRSHINAAAGLAEVEWHTDDADFSRGDARK